MSKYPKTDDGAFNKMKFNMKSKPQKVETLAEQIARLDKAVAKDTERINKAKRLKVLMATKPIFTRAMSLEDIKELDALWNKENAKELAELTA